MVINIWTRVRFMRGVSNVNFALSCFRILAKEVWKVALKRITDEVVERTVFRVRLNIRIMDDMKPRKIPVQGEVQIWLWRW